MTTNPMVDLESPTPTSYKWSIVTFTLSCTIFELFVIFFIMGFPMWGPQNGGFQPLAPSKGVDRYRICLGLEHGFGCKCVNEKRGNAEKNL